MKIHVLQHVAFETPGTIDLWCNNKGHKTTTSHLYRGDSLPALHSFDLLVVMGGPMGVYDVDKFAWLEAEISFIGQAIAANKAVIGICLGSQLIAAAMGKKVFPNKQKEIGWYPISFTEAAQKHPLFSKFPQSMTVFHWHGDTFDLPNEAELIATSAACTNQIFSINDKVIGLQCHLEVTPHTLAAMADNCSAELITGQSYIQSRAQIDNYAGLHELEQWIVAILNFLESKC